MNIKTLTHQFAVQFCILLAVICMVRHPSTNPPMIPNPNISDNSENANTVGSKFGKDRSRPVPGKTPMRRGSPAPLKLTQKLYNPDPFSQPQYDANKNQYEPGSIGEQNYNANRGVYEPGSIGDQNAKANQTGKGMANDPTRPPLPVGVKPAPGSGNTEAGKPVGTGAPLGAAGVDTPQAYRTSVTPSPARALGFGNAGPSIPGGDDVASPGLGKSAGFSGGTGDMQRSFSNPTSANIYHDYTKKLFNSPTPDADASQPVASTGLKKAKKGKGAASAPESFDGGRDNGEMDGDGQGG